MLIPRLFYACIIIAMLALGLWVLSLRIDFCMQASDLAWWQCALISGGK